jgi:hypothetical protein
MGLMSFFRRQPAVPDEQIIGAIDPWMLACGAASENGSLGARIPWDSWYRLSVGSWMPKVQAVTGASEPAIKAAFERYRDENCHLHYQSIMRREEASRGMKPSVVLGPGESITVEIPLI